MHIYFSGIGGVGLGPLAEIARDCGFVVSGSDAQASPTFQALKEQGFSLSLDQTGKHIQAVHADQPIDWFVYTAALPADHPELRFAHDNNIKATKRDELLKEIIRQKNLKLIAVAGTHGKTTTTAMVVWLFRQLKVPVSYLVGAPLSWAPSGTYMSGSSYFVYECDEFDRNFLQFHPFLSLITSIDYDHADTYPTPETYHRAFEQFRGQSEQTITWQEVDPGLVHLTGEHNRRNGSLATCAVSQLTDQPLEKVADLLASFPGSSRRFEKLADNLYSDYAHHPDEIAATLQLASELSDHIVAVYQPHQNIRQHTLRESYGSCFDRAQKIYWLPTYLSREDPGLVVLTSKEVARSVDQTKIVYSQLDDTLWQQIEQERRAGHMVVMMGAGSVDGWVRQQLASGK